MKIDLTSVPFSRFGSYLACSVLPASENRPAGLYIRSLHGGGSAFRAPALRMELLSASGALLPFEASASATLLTLASDPRDDCAPKVDLLFTDANTLRMRGLGAGLRLSIEPGVYDHLFRVDDRRWQFNCFSWDAALMVSLLNGSLQVDAPWKIMHSERIVIDLLPGDDGICQLALEETQPVWRVREFATSFDEDDARATEEFKHWVDTVPTLPDEYAEARRLAAYVTWSGVVEPQGFLNWPAMFMSKNWMNNVWSWDHCFNAMALTYKHPAMAWDQLRVVFDQQDMYGALPDSVNDRSMVFSFVKPPIHGLTLAWMLERTSFIRKEQLHQIYGPLCRWTEWWFSYRDYDNDGIPQYHHGNDSGWDNATVFDVGMPLESPDLSAFLILQMETLGTIAARLGHLEEAESWQRRSEELLEKMLAHFWQGDHFVALRSGDHLVSDTDSLLLYLPLILGRRLPAVLRSDLVSGLTRPGRFITPFGLASELPASPRYEPDGYWRGPIWAPATWLIIEGLSACGETELAHQLARRFCDTAAHNGFAENFDALTGDALRDHAYTWTASVFLLLGHEYLLPVG